MVLSLLTSTFNTRSYLCTTGPQVYSLLSTVVPKGQFYVKRRVISPFEACHEDVKQIRSNFIPEVLKELHWESVPSRGTFYFLVQETKSKEIKKFKIVFCTLLSTSSVEARTKASSNQSTNQGSPKTAGAKVPVGRQRQLFSPAEPELGHYSSTVLSCERSKVSGPQKEKTVKNKPWQDSASPGSQILPFHPENTGKTSAYSSGGFLLNWRKKEFDASRSSV